MNNKEYNEIYDILISLQKEFSSEESRLKEISKSHAFRIDELDQQITTARRNEDIDFRVFSPRNVTIDNSDKINALESEKASLEKEKKEADKNMGYYTGKAEKIARVLYILKNSFEGDSIIEVDDESTEDIENLKAEEQTEDIFFPKKRKPFDFLDEDYKEEVVEDTVEDDTNLKELFSKSAIDYGISVSSDDDSDEINLKKNSDSSDNTVSSGVPVEEVKRVCHKVEFSEKIINNDRVRAKLELKEIITELNELINAYK